MYLHAAHFNLAANTFLGWWHLFCLARWFSCTRLVLSPVIPAFFDLACRYSPGEHEDKVH